MAFPQTTGGGTMAPMSDEPWREGGEPACMLHLVCPECGRIRERRGDPVCEHCGAAAEDEDTGRRVLDGGDKS